MVDLFLFTLIICVICITISEIFKNLSESRYYEKSIQKMDEIKKEILEIRTEPARKRLEEIADGIREQFENY